MAEGLPARIDRAALERIIQRAAELQTAERDVGDGLTETEVMALAAEVGIPGRYLQQALLEERTRLAQTTPAGRWERFAGPGTVTAQRVVMGKAEELGDALTQYMEEHELFCIQRRQPGRISWEPLRGFQAAIRRSTAAFGGGKRPLMLAKAETVAAAFMPLESGYVHVTLQADVRGYRSAYVGGGAAAASTGVASAAVLAALGVLPLVALAPVPLGLGLGYVILRQFPPKLSRLQLGLERALDHLEQGQPKPSHQLPSRQPGILGLLAEEVRRSIRPPNP